LSDYQILVQLNSSNFDFSKANSDGSDIRFVDEDDATKLSYWIEEWDSVNESAKIWVKVPSIPTGEKTIYLYYNNSDAVSESDGDAVFEFFDDFEDYSVGSHPTKWADADLGDGITEVTNVTSYHGVKCLLQNAGGSGNGARATKIADGGAWGNVVISTMYYDKGGRNAVVVGTYEPADDPTSWGNEYLYLKHNSENYTYTEHSDGASTSGDTSIPRKINQWVKFEFRYFNGVLKAYIDGQLAHTTTKIDNVGRILLLDWWGSTNDDYHDLVIVRKYTEPEPSVNMGVEKEVPPIEVACISPSTLQVQIRLIEKKGYILIGTSPDKFTYAYEFHGSGTYTLTTTFLLPNETYYIKACDIDGDCTSVVEFVCSKETELEKKNFTSQFNTLMQGGNLLNISKLGETIPSVYTSLLTDMFWAMFFGGIFLAYWIRQEDVMLPSIVGLISGSVMIVMLPPSAQHIAYILLVISIAGTLYTIIKARR